MTLCKSGLHDKDETLPDGTSGRDPKGECRRCRRANRARYNTTASGREAQRRYVASDNGRHVRNAYRRSPAGQESASRTEGRPGYQSWKAIVQRTTNPKNKDWAAYGGRGIRMCQDWLDSFEAFADYVGPKPSPEHTIDRIDVNGDYAPGNVRWATSVEQRRNRRDSHR